MAYMTRLMAVVSVFLLSGCLVVAQNLSPAPVPAAAQPAVTSAESPAIQEFQKIEDAWDDAINQRDQYALELVLSPLFMDVSASGDFTTRNQQLALLITGEDKTLHLEQRVITVRMLASWTARVRSFAARVYTSEHERVRVRSEDKEAIAAFHWRGAPDEEAAAAAVKEIARRAEEEGFAVHWGRKVLEVRPPVALDKGIGIAKLLRGETV